MSIEQLEVIDQWDALNDQIAQCETTLHALQQAADNLLTDYATRLATRHGVEIGQLYRNAKSGDFWIVTGFQAGVYSLDGDPPEPPFIRVQVRLQKVKQGRRLKRIVVPLLQQLVESETLPAVNPMLHRYELTGQPDKEGAAA